MEVIVPVASVVEVAEGMLLKVILSVELCHWIVPVFPDKVIVVLPDWQNVLVPAVAVPATETGDTVTA